MDKLKIGLIDDHPLFTESLASILTKQQRVPCEINFIAHSGAQAMKEMDFRGPDINLILLDLNLGDADGQELIKPFKEKWPGIRIMIVTGYDNPTFVRNCFQNGADGYMLKSHTIENLWDGISTVMRGETFMGENVRIFSHDKSKDSTNTYSLRDSFILMHNLTKREKEILDFIVKAKTNKQIGKILFISDQTVGVHRKNIMRKLGVNNTASLVKKAIELNLISE